MAAILALLYPIIYFVRKSRESMHQSYEASKSASYDIQRVVENLFLIKLLKKRVTNYKDILIGSMTRKSI